MYRKYSSSLPLIKERTEWEGQNIQKILKQFDKKQKLKKKLLNSQKIIF